MLSGHLQKLLSTKKEWQMQFMIYMGQIYMMRFTENTAMDI